MPDCTPPSLIRTCNPFYHIKVLSLGRIPLLIRNCWSLLFPI
jgi:hypothetical protein